MLNRRSGVLQRVRHLLLQEQWFLAVAPRARHGLFEADPRAFQLIAAPRGHFYADPFLLTHDGSTYIFCEDYDHDVGKGTITCMRQVESGGWSSAFVVLLCDYHLSYPCVFVDG